MGKLGTQVVSNLVIFSKILISTAYGLVKRFYIPSSANDDINFMFDSFMVNETFRSYPSHFFCECFDVWKSEGFQETIARLDV